MFKKIDYQILWSEICICFPNLQRRIEFLSTNLETNCVIGKEDSIDGTTDGPENPNDGDEVQQCLQNPNENNGIQIILCNNLIDSHLKIPMKV